MLLIQKLRGALRIYSQQGFKETARISREQTGMLWHAYSAWQADADAKATYLSEIINNRAEFGHLFIASEDVTYCRKQILRPYLFRQFTRCIDISTSFGSDLTPIELCLYADSLYRLWDFKRLVEIADLVRERSDDTKFAARADQITVRAYFRLGLLTHAARRLETAGHEESDVGALFLAAEVWDGLGRMDLATKAYERAIRKHSDNPVVRLHYGFHQLKKGALLEGLTSWGMADRMLGVYPMRARSTLWRGEPLEDRVLLVLFEHGLGDMIQFSRFLVQVEERWPRAQLIGRVPAPLAGLMGTSFPRVGFISDQEEDPAYDFYVPSVQLGAVLETRSLEPSTRYIKLGAPHGIPAQGTRPRPRIGICWRGAPREYEQVRSIPIEVFSTLFQDMDVDFVVLLNKLTTLERAFLQTFANVLIPEIGDFLELSALIAGCDLVVSVDTAVVHVAGAAGWPVLLLARPDSCWRWGPSGERSPWYPSVRILRHPGDLDWPFVLANAREHIANMLSHEQARAAEWHFAQAV